MTANKPMQSEIVRRGSLTADVLALFESRPLEWISWQEIAKVAGACGWRTRVSECRKIVRKSGGDVVWNRKLSSAYRLVPHVPLGRPAHEYVAQKGLF